MPVSLLLLLIGIIAEQQDAGLRNLNAGGGVLKLNVSELVHEIDAPAGGRVGWIDDDREATFRLKGHGRPAFLVDDGELIRRLWCQIEVSEFQHDDAEVRRIRPGVDWCIRPEAEHLPSSESISLRQSFETATQ